MALTHQTRAAEAVALIQPAIDNQKRLVEKARTDFTALCELS
jgi:hypothetical protein